MDRLVLREESWWRTRRFANILIASSGFMLVMTAFFTSSAIGNSVVHDMQKYGFHDSDGYLSLAILFAAQLVVTPFVPLVVKYIGGKWSLIAGGITQLLYIATFELTSRTLLLIVSAVYGAGTNIIWAGMGVVLTANSDVTNSTKCIGIFWAIFNCSQIWGNIIVAVKFLHLDVIDDDTRRVTYGALMVLVVAGCITFLFIKEEGRNSIEVTNNNAPAVSVNSRTCVREQTWWQKFWNSCSMFNKPSFRTIVAMRYEAPPVVLLSICFICFPGVNVTLLSTVVPTAVGFDKHFGAFRKELIGIAGFITGAAEIVGALFMTFVIRGRISRTIVCISGLCLSATAMGFSVLNMPLYSALNDSANPTILFGKNGSSVTICIICAALFGLSDAATNISITALESDIFGHDEHDKGKQNVSVVVTAAREVPAALEGDVVVKGHGEPLASVATEKSNVQQMMDEAATATAFAVGNGVQALLAAIILFLSSQLWLNTYFYILVPVCILTSSAFFVAERNYRAGKYRNYFRNLQQ